MGRLFLWSFLFLCAFATCGGPPPMVNKEEKKKEVRPLGPDSTLQQLREVGKSQGVIFSDSLTRDSLSAVMKVSVREKMNDVLKDYAHKFKVDYFNGYFMTDLDNDGFKEMWVVTGHNRQNSRLQLFYPQPDGSLKLSTEMAEPGEYYLGSDYLVQIVTSGPGVINCNRITINRNGMMDVENILEIDKFETPDKAIPKYSEPRIKLTPINNRSLLNQAYK